jgi:hypothetical protein
MEKLYLSAIVLLVSSLPFQSVQACGGGTNYQLLDSIPSASGRGNDFLFRVGSAENGTCIYVPEDDGVFSMLVILAQNEENLTAAIRSEVIKTSQMVDWKNTDPDYVKEQQKTECTVDPAKAEEPVKVKFAKDIQAAIKASTGTAMEQSFGSEPFYQEFKSAAQKYKVDMAKSTVPAALYCQLLKFTFDEKVIHQKAFGGLATVYSASPWSAKMITGCASNSTIAGLKLDAKAADGLVAAGYLQAKKDASGNPAEYLGLNTRQEAKVNAILKAGFDPFTDLRRSALSGPKSRGGCNPTLTSASSTGGTAPSSILLHPAKN